jgi:predicted nuclease of restriction endonuclease-like (RecB) superfamily
VVVGIRGARFDILCKENIAFLGELENDFVFIIVATLILIEHETYCIGNYLFIFSCI